MVRQRREEEQRPCERQTVLGFKNDSGLMEDGKECEDEIKCARPGTYIADLCQSILREGAIHRIAGVFLFQAEGFPA